MPGLVLWNLFCFFFQRLSGTSVGKLGQWACPGRSHPPSLWRRLQETGFRRSGEPELLCVTWPLWAPVSSSAKWTEVGNLACSSLRSLPALIVLVSGKVVSTSRYHIYDTGTTDCYTLVASGRHDLSAAALLFSGLGHAIRTLNTVPWPTLLTDQSWTYLTCWSSLWKVSIIQDRKVAGLNAGLAHPCLMSWSSSPIAIFWHKTYNTTVIHNPFGGGWGREME